MAVLLKRRHGRSAQSSSDKQTGKCFRHGAGLIGGNRSFCDISDSMKDIADVTSTFIDGVKEKTFWGETARLTYAKERDQERDEYREDVLWSNETENDLFGSRMFGMTRVRTTTVNNV